MFAGFINTKARIGQGSKILWEGKDQEERHQREKIKANERGKARPLTNLVYTDHWLMNVFFFFFRCLVFVQTINLLSIPTTNEPV